MASQRRRTEIQIETHEITIIRFGQMRRAYADVSTDESADVTLHQQLTTSEDLEESNGGSDTEKETR